LQLVIQAHTAAGNKLAEKGDLFGALPWFVEALRLEKDPARASMHQLRLTTTLDQCPKLLQWWRHDDEVPDVAISLDGRWVASGSRDKTARVWDAETGEAVCPPLVHPIGVNGLSFSLDGRRLLTRSSIRPDQYTETPVNPAGQVKVWSLPSGELLFTLAHTGFVHSAEF